MHLEAEGTSTGYAHPDSNLGGRRRTRVHGVAGGSRWVSAEINATGGAASSVAGLVARRCPDDRGGSATGGALFPAKGKAEGCGLGPVSPGGGGFDFAVQGTWQQGDRRPAEIKPGYGEHLPKTDLPEAARPFTN